MLPFEALPQNTYQIYRALTVSFGRLVFRGAWHCKWRGLRPLVRSEHTGCFSQTLTAILSTANIFCLFDWLFFVSSFVCFVCLLVRSEHTGCFSQTLTANLSTANIVCLFDWLFVCLFVCFVCLFVRSEHIGCFSQTLTTNLSTAIIKLAIFQSNSHSNSTLPQT